MRLTLKIAGCEVLEDGSPAAFVIDSASVVIGRSPRADWILPDRRKHVSMFHCEIARRDDDYVIIDRSTNGTLVNDEPIGLGVPHPIGEGDRVTIGTYEMIATIDQPTIIAATPSPPVPASAPPLPSAPVASDDRGPAMPLLRHMLKGLMRLMEARAEAKADIGLEQTMIALHGNNPLKFTKTVDGALNALMAPPAPGFMTASRAIDDAFLDLQAHEAALTAATHAALEFSIKTFSPAAIRASRQREGWLARMVPALHEAALWRTYERTFAGAVQSKDEALRAMLATEFRREYERRLAEVNDRRRHKSRHPA